MHTQDFDRFIAERAGRRRLRILGRDVEAPSELPWWYVLRLQRALEDGGSIPGEVNISLVKQLLSDEDYRYITGHPDFRGSWFWEIIAFGWLSDAAGEAHAPGGFTTEDDMKAEASPSKKAPSAPSNCGRTLRLTSSAPTAST